MSSPIPGPEPNPPNYNAANAGSNANPKIQTINASGDLAQGDGEGLKVLAVGVDVAPAPTYVVQDYSAGNPCCMPLQMGVYLIVFMEIFAYLIGLGFYVYLYLKLSNTTVVTDTRDVWSSYHYYRNQLANGVPFERITEYLTYLALAEICCCSLYVLLALLLLIGGIKRKFSICITWVCGVFALTICRLALLLLAPIHAFQLGFIWFVFELYFMWAVVCFAIDCRINPDGTEVYAVPYSEAIYSGGYGGSPIMGYKLAGYKSTVLTQSRPTGRNQNNANNNEPEPGNGGRQARANNAEVVPRNATRQVQYNQDAPRGLRYTRTYGRTY